LCAAAQQHWSANFQHHHFRHSNIAVDRCKVLLLWLFNSFSAFLALCLSFFFFALDFLLAKLYSIWVASSNENDMPS
jgi:hypothetical protein